MIIVLFIWAIAILVGVLIGAGKNRTLDAVVLTVLLAWLGVIIVACLSDRAKQI